MQAIVLERWLLKGTAGVILLVLHLSLQLCNCRIVLISVLNKKDELWLFMVANKVLKKYVR